MCSASKACESIMPVQVLQVLEDISCYFFVTLCTELFILYACMISKHLLNITSK